jgi:hypothetical protein
MGDERGTSRGSWRSGLGLVKELLASNEDFARQINIVREDPSFDLVTQNLLDASSSSRITVYLAMAWRIWDRFRTS